MAPQTRFGFVVLILLVGCLLAIPHFRHPLGAPKQTPETSPSAEAATTLKLKADPATARKKAALVTSPIPIPTPRGLASQRSINSSTAPLQSSQAGPPPLGEREQWKFPPVAKAQEPTRATAGSVHARSPSKPQRETGVARPRSLRLPPEAMASLPSGQPNVRSENQHSRLPSNGYSKDGWAGDTSRSDRGLITDRPRQTVTVGRSQLVQRRADRVAETAPALHRIVNGDTLENLARQYYGDPRKAMLIFESNRHALLNPAILPLGVDLTIPNVSH